jgi:hypothetical protein
MAAPKKAPAKATPKAPPTSTSVTIFVPRGKVRAGDILTSALMAASDEIPDAALDVKPVVISASDVRTDDRGIEGRDYRVDITWTPRNHRASTANEEDEAPGTVDKVLESLEPLTPEKVSAVITPPETGSLV